MKNKYLWVLLTLCLVLTSCSNYSKQNFIQIPIPQTTITSNYYAEGFYYNSTGGGTPYTITISSTNTNYNLTNWSAGEYNGFTFENNGITANYKGIYQLSGSITFTGGNDEYAFVMTKDNVPISKCGMGVTGTSSNRDNIAITCLISLEKGEHLNLQVIDKNTPPTNVDVYKTNLNIIKIN